MQEESTERILLSMAEEVPTTVEKPKFHFKEKDLEKGKEINRTKLTLKQKKAVAEYVRTGNKTASYKAAYNCNPKTAQLQANRLFKRPKIVDALTKALKDNKFDENFAVKTLKDIVDSGMENKDITRPDTALKALETYWKVTGALGGGNKMTVKVDLESRAKKMDMTEIRQSLKELDKRQKHLIAIMEGKKPVVEEGEIVQ